jgi:hypothetical protein
MLAGKGIVGVIVGGLRFNRKERFVECAGTLSGIKRWSDFRYVLAPDGELAAVVARQACYVGTGHSVTAQTLRETGSSPPGGYTGATLLSCGDISQLFSELSLQSARSSYGSIVPEPFQPVRRDADAKTAAAGVFAQATCF